MHGGAADVGQVPQGAGALVSLENAGLNRSGRWLVRGVDLTVLGGPVVTLIGPDGSGKSTAARVGLGLAAPSAG